MRMTFAQLKAAARPLHYTLELLSCIHHASISFTGVLLCCNLKMLLQVNLLYCVLLAVHWFTSLTHVAAAAQYEISLDAYNRLTSTPDAKGRKIEVVKVPIPYPLFRTYKEADGLHVSSFLRLLLCHVSCPESEQKFQG